MSLAVIVLKNFKNNMLSKNKSNMSYGNNKNNIITYAENKSQIPKTKNVDTRLVFFILLKIKRFF